MKEKKNVDITPKPRILRTLGEIPFQPWQCFAELVDNSIDAFLRIEREKSRLIEDKSVIIKWSGEGVAAQERVIEIEDNADGMSISQISNMARAGYSGNNPVDNLGLFGMGFNIATARLGERTQVLSAREEDKEWTGIEIDFSELIKNEEFAAPIITRPKEKQDEHGTRIIISKIKLGIYRDLINGEGAIRKRLENVYSPILTKSDTKIFVQGKRLSARSHCVWSKDRSVTRNGQKIGAVIDIDHDLGEEFFDTERNAYVPESAISGDAQRKNSIIRRPMRLKGWVGIQRFSDPNDYGIDFVRNGRKILISDKTLFYYENPFTGTQIIEYPKELASTWGGRVVGEIHVDYLLPTYQKNDFDRSDRSWLRTVEAIRGTGPILPRQRKGLGFSDENLSPLGKLVNAYRRQDPGTKNLSVEQSLAREFAEQFYRGNQEYITDEKWWKAAQDADRRIAGQDGGAAVVDEGSAPSDDIGSFLTLTQTAPVEISQKEELPKNSDLSDLLSRSEKIDHLSKSYGYARISPFEVSVYKVNSGDIWTSGVKVPAHFSVDGIHCDFFYNPRHSLFSQYQLNQRDLLAVYLSERFKARDRLPDIGAVFAQLVQENNQDLRVDRTTLQERAGLIFDTMRQTMQVALGPVCTEVISCIKESTGECEETIQQMLPDSPLIDKFQKGRSDAIGVLSFVPNKTLIRLIDRFPDKVLDGKVFNIRYLQIEIDDQKATERLRNEAKDRLMSFLKDAVWVATLSGSQSTTLKDELIRCLYSINSLENQLCQ